MGEIQNEEEAAAVLGSMLEDVFLDAFFPVESPFDLIPLLPDGKDTVFTVGKVKISAKDIGMKYNDHQEYPYDSSDQLIEDIIKSVQKHGDLFIEDKNYKHSMTIKF